MRVGNYEWNKRGNGVGGIGVSTTYTIKLTQYQSIKGTTGRQIDRYHPIPYIYLTCSTYLFPVYNFAALWKPIEIVHL